MEHVACGVHERRRLHARAQGAAQDSERSCIGGERTCLLHIFVRRMCTAGVGKAEVRQDARAKACAMTCARQRDDGHAHVERVTCRTAARVRECVERDVDLAVGREVLRRMAFGSDAGEVDARRLQAAERLLSAVRRIEDRRLEEEARAWHGTEDLRPKMQALVRDLREVVETAERNIALLPRGQGRDSGFFPRAARTVAEVTLGQTQELLRKAAVVFPMRVDIRVRQEIIDR